MIYITLLVVFISSLLLTYFIKNYFIKNSILQGINQRSSHTIPTPHGGGIALALSYFGGIGFLFYTNNIDSSLFYALSCGIILAIVSFLDDLYDLSFKLRLLIQAIVSAGALYFLGGFEVLYTPFVYISNPIITNTFAFFMFLWFINLYNFIDGINGYAGSEAVFLSLGGYILFGAEHFLILAVASLGFLYFNYNKAKIFMGDVGSTLLGFNIAVFAIYYANIEPNGLLMWIVLFSVFWFDATFTLIKRLINKENLAQAHKQHCFHRLTALGWSHFKICNYAIGINLILFALVYFVSNILYAFIASLILMIAIERLIAYTEHRTTHK